MQSNPTQSRGTKGFWPLVVAQFQAAFSDHAYENLLMQLAAFGVAGAVAASDANVSYVLIVFTLPFMLVSPFGGQFADKFSKRTIAIVVKMAEIGIMVAAAGALMTGQLWVSLLVLALMGVRAGFFGPAKYGVIPEIVPERRLSWANGVIELTLFTAIMGGTVAGLYLFKHFNHNLPLAILPLIALSIAGAAVSFGIKRVPAASPERRISANAVAELWRYFKYARADRVLWLAVVGNAFFWFCGGVVYQNVVIYAKHVLQITEDEAAELAYLRLGVMVGIGGGSYLAGVLSRGKIEYGLIPLGALAMVAGCFHMAFAEATLWGTVAALTVLGLGGGFFLVPVQSLVQHRPDPRNKGGVQGMAYFLTNAASLAAGFSYLGMVHAGMDARHVYIALGLAIAAVAGYLLWLLPDSLLRLALWILGSTIYRIRVVGRDNIPGHGGALFVCNHMSFADALFVTASTERHVRFIMHSDYYNHALVRPVAKLMRAIPIAAEMGPRAMIRALRDASDAVRAGDVVCIFAEGEITRTGFMLPFRRGFERIMRGVDAPVIPMHLDRVWGSIFSFEQGRFIWKWPHRIPYPVTVSYGAPMPPTATAPEIRRAVQELATEAFAHRRADMRPLHREFVATARRAPRRRAMADGLVPRVTFFNALVRSLVLGRVLRRRWQGDAMVGVLLPPSVAGACVNVAAMLAGKVPVNLNYTLSPEGMESCIRQCGIRTVVTSSAFLEKARLAAPPGAVLLEDLIPEASGPVRVFAVFAAALYPAFLLERAMGARRRAALDDTATVIFSSGSTGDPKGVMLSHYNVLSNVQGIAQVMTVSREDRLMGVLPFFHSFGFTGTLWFPLTRGIGVVFHPNPLDSRTIGALVARHRATLMVATPTFLQGYIRRVDPGQFGSLRYVMVGAEKLPERVAVAFEDRFGIRPYEAYGCTECAPAVSANVPGFRAAGFYQVGGKRQHIGHPLPGVSVRIADPDTLEPLPVGRPGMLLVRGPNVMQGYLGQPEKTAEVIRDGWYVTGDIAALDEDGFLVITDRLSRFSKIGGEMVPHVRVEDVLHELAGTTQRVFAVTGVPDDRKGERLVVVHTLDDERLALVLERLPNAGLPNLWIPKADAFIRVEAIPVLGTGKTDFRKVREVALGLAET